MRARLRVWFLRHWFIGVFVIIGGLWAITSLAYAVGAKQINFGRRFGGPAATIDFMREHDHPVVALGDGVGLMIRTAYLNLGAPIVRFGPGLPGLCLVCGRNEPQGTIAYAEFRQGDWFYRAPEEPTQTRPAALAYNRRTGEVLTPDARSSLADEVRALATRGLPADGARLTLEGLSDLQPVSMMREGCVIFHFAFVAVVALWLVFGGAAALIVRLIRRPA